VLRFVTLILRMQRSTANVLALKRHDGFRIRDVIQREPKDISQISLDTIIFLGGTELFFYSYHAYTYLPTWGGLETCQ
jgi:hypothetical protein